MDSEDGVLLLSYLFYREGVDMEVEAVGDTDCEENVCII